MEPIFALLSRLVYALKSRNDAILHERKRPMVPSLDMWVLHEMTLQISISLQQWTLPVLLIGLMVHGLVRHLGQRYKAVLRRRYLAFIPSPLNLNISMSKAYETLVPFRTILRHIQSRALCGMTRYTIDLLRSNGVIMV